MPPVPTFPIVKLRPSLVSAIGSRGFVFLPALRERCLKTSVLFFARRSEFDLFFCVVLGAELFLKCLRDPCVSGLLALFPGLEPCCEVAGKVVAPVI